MTKSRQARPPRQQHAGLETMPRSAGDPIDAAAAVFCDRFPKEFEQACVSVADWIVEAAGCEPREELVESFKCAVMELVCASGQIPAVDPGYERVFETAGKINPVAWFLHRFEVHDDDFRYLMAATAAPRGLYQVSQVTPGRSATLINLVDTAAGPIVVSRTGFLQYAEPGLVIGARVLNLGTHHSVSSVVVCLTRMRPVLQEVGAYRRQIANRAPPVVDPRDLGIPALVAWVKEQEPAQAKHFITADGEPLHLVTDHFLVRNLRQLVRNLSRDADRTGRCSWVKRTPSAHLGASVKLHPGGDLQVFYESRHKAAEYRRWFEACAGSSAEFARREEHDLQKFLDDVHRDRESVEKQLTVSNPRGMELLRRTELMQQMIEEASIGWESRPLPLLDYQSPSELCKTAAGRERVRAALAFHERCEARLAEMFGREPASYQFLWDRLKLKRAG